MLLNILKEISDLVQIVQGISLGHIICGKCSYFFRYSFFIEYENPPLLSSSIHYKNFYEQIPGTGMCSRILIKNSQGRNHNL